VAAEETDPAKKKKHNRREGKTGGRRAREAKAKKQLGSGDGVL